jgi:hypothetical protein
MSREAHVQFYESLGVRFPGATHLVVGFRTPDGCGAVPARIPGAPREVRFGTASGEDTADRVWTVHRPERAKRGEEEPETFTFLGFTHHCGKRQNGTFTVWRKTAKKRLVAKLQAIKVELIRQRHAPVAQVGEWLRKVVSGYYQYHAVPGNLGRLLLFRHRLRQVWWSVLTRRSQRGKVSRKRLNALLERWVPAPRVLHPYPMHRFDATHPRWKPYA